MAVSNKDVEVLSEAMFCYYFAIWNKGKQSKLEPKDFNNFKNSTDLNKWTRDLGLNGVIDNVNSDPALMSRVSKIGEFLNQKDQRWHNNLVMQMEKFFSNSKIKVGQGKYRAMRADKLPPAINPYKAYEEISKKVKGKLGFKGRVDKDKWNPSDVWIISTKCDAQLKTFINVHKNRIMNNPEYCVDYMNKLNNFIRDQFRRGNIFPVSLKAPSGGRVVITFENDKFDAVKKVVRYTKIEFTDTNQDAKIRFAVDKVNIETGKVVKKDYINGSIKTKTVKSGGARLEIEGGSGAGARYGSMGTENYQWIIKETDMTGIKELNSIRNQAKFTDLKKKYWTAVTGREWLGRGKYVKAFNKDKESFAEEIAPYTQELYKKINNKLWDAAAVRGAKSEEEKWLNKTHAGEVAIAMDKITKQMMKDITTENLFNLAASQGFGAGVSKSQIEIRKRAAKQLGGKIGTAKDKELNAIPMDEANKIWESCFYVVVK